MKSVFPNTSNQIYSLVERQNSSRLIRILFFTASREFVFRIWHSSKIPSDYPFPAHKSVPGWFTFSHTFFISFPVVVRQRTFFRRRILHFRVTVFDFRFLFHISFKKHQKPVKFPIRKDSVSCSTIFFLPHEPENKVSKASNAMLLTRQIIDAVRTNDERRK